MVSFEQCREIRQRLIMIFFNEKRKREERLRGARRVQESLDDIFLCSDDTEFLDKMRKDAYEKKDYVLCTKVDKRLIEQCR